MFYTVCNASYLCAYIKHNFYFYKSKPVTECYVESYIHSNDICKRSIINLQVVTHKRCNNFFGKFRKMLF